MSTISLGQHLRASNDAAKRRVLPVPAAETKNPWMPWDPSAQDLADVQEFFDVALASWVSGIQAGKTTSALAIHIGRISAGDAKHERIYQLLPVRYFSETLRLKQFTIKRQFREIWYQFLASLAEHDLKAKWSCETTKAKDYTWATLRVSPK